MSRRRSSGKGNNRPSGKGGNKRGGKSRNRKRKPAKDADRPMWEADTADAMVQAVTEFVHPAQDPTALVHSLGPPPLGRFADNAEHYYRAVYEKSQRFAIALAAANGVQLTDRADGEAESGATADGHSPTNDDD